MTSAFQFQEWITSHSERTESALDRLIDSAQTIPHRLHEAMRYAAQGGGKRIRPLLVYAAGQLGDQKGVADSAALDAAAVAIELIHAYSLVHDDLPCMDDDDLRRGRPTVHKAYDEATALLVGDALQSMAFGLIANSDLSESQKVRIISSLAISGGLAGMAGGQAIDLENVGKPLTKEALENMHRLKTGALLRTAVQMGGIAIDLNPQQLKSLDQYASALGLAFQVVDDILDATADSATLGKTAGKDAAQDKPTYVTLKGLDYANELAKELKGRALDSLNEFGPQADALRHLAHLVVDRKK